MADATPSRYHSTHRRQPSLDQNPTTPEDDNVTRTKSRYRRKQQGFSTESSPDVPDRPPSDAQQQANAPLRYHSTKIRQSPLNTLYREQVVEAPLQHFNTKSNDRRNGPERDDPPTAPGASDRKGPTSEDLESKQYQSVNSREGYRQQSPPLSAPQLSPPLSSPLLSQPTGELFPPVRPAEPRKIDGPPQSAQIRATKSTSELPRFANEETPGCFAGLFRRKKPEGVPADQASSAPKPKTAKADAAAIRAGVVPGKDAPKSAINTGDRRVLIECGKTKTYFPVTPTTTSVDLIKSAALCMPERIESKSAILLEHFCTVGVQRPLRRYEHIRDVMNSWDNDGQNSLLLVDPGTGTVERELTITGVPRNEPEEQSWLLSYSQKVGKWDKRLITLRSTGQILCQKDPEKAREVVNVCHLSDFDIYTPTPEKLKKKIKPPKKMCYAIKSQQKTSLFESTENFVHFFSTGDRETADSFYNAVQGWRSWYLVHVLGEGKKEQEKEAARQASSNGVAEATRRPNDNDPSKTHRVKESLESQYQLGSFKPLIDMDQFDRRASAGRPSMDNGNSYGGFNKSANQFDVNISPERRASTSKRQHPPIALNRKAQLADDEPLANLSRKVSVTKRTASSNQNGSETGLLGQTYSQRRREQEPSTSGSTSLNRTNTHSADQLGASGDGLRRQTSTRKQTNSTGDLKRSSSTRGPHNRGSSIDLERSGTRRQMPKPLIDLTPQYKEPPQHSKKGRGFVPDQIKPGGLISDATTPEDPLGLPTATVFRNMSGSYNDSNSPGLIDLTPQHQEPVHHAKKGRGYRSDNSGGNGGLVSDATTPEDPLGLPQNTTFRSTNTATEGRRRAGSVSDQQPIRRQLSTSKAAGPFTGEGLLASHKEGWGTATKGRGVIDGSRAGGKPLVDLTEQSQYASGSLLATVERAAPIPAPIIDREKREERKQKYGEGY